MEKYVSKEYKERLQAYREKRKNWGGISMGKIQKVFGLAAINQCKSILDYGAGASHLKNGLKDLFPDHTLQINEYEPSIKELNVEPKESDLVVCVDVLEHVEPEKIDAVLDHIKEKTLKLAYIVVCTVPAQGTFDDGSNLHLIVEDHEWWTKKLLDRFDIKERAETVSHLMVVVTPKNTLD